MSSHISESGASNGAAFGKWTPVVSDDRAAPASSGSVLTQASVMLGLLTGLWVATFPWLLVLQHGGSNATAGNLIVGLAVIALGLFAISGSRGFPGLQAGSMLAGIWLIVSPFILNAKHTIATPMYCSNIFAGAPVAAPLASPPCSKPGALPRGNRRGTTGHDSYEQKGP